MTPQQDQFSAAETANRLRFRHQAVPGRLSAECKAPCGVEIDLPLGSFLSS
jgi:hypothetical protein